MVCKTVSQYLELEPTFVDGTAALAGTAELATRGDMAQHFSNVPVLFPLLPQSPQKHATSRSKNAKFHNALDSPALDRPSICLRFEISFAFTVHQRSPNSGT